MSADPNLLAEMRAGELVARTWLLTRTWLLKGEPIPGGDVTRIRRADRRRQFSPLCFTPPKVTRQPVPTRGPDTATRVPPADGPDSGEMAEIFGTNSHAHAMRVLDTGAR